MGPKLHRELSKRMAHPELDHNLITSVAAFEEVLGVILRNRFPNARLALMNRRNEKMARIAEELIGKTSVLVASHGTAWRAFQTPNPGALRVLNQQSGHPRHMREVMSIELLKYGIETPTMSAKEAVRFDRFDEEYFRSDLILVGSTFARDSLIREGVDGSKVAVVPYGVDVELFSPIDESEMDMQRDRFNVLFVGTLTEGKGVHYLMEAYRRFRTPKTTLTMVGDDELKSGMTLSGDPSVKTVPRVARCQLPSYYRQAAVFVLPTLFEGMGMVVLEAMACGIPVVVTNRGPNEVVRDGVDGFIISAEDSDAITERLQLLYEKPDLRRSMGQNARLRALQYSWDQYSRRALDAILSAYTSKSV